jgi:hypothetical protein
MCDSKLKKKKGNLSLGLIFLPAGLLEGDSGRVEKGFGLLRQLPDPGFFFLFLHFFQLNFAKTYGPKKFAKLYIWCREERRQGPTAVPHSGRKLRGTVAPHTVVGTALGVRSLFKNL